ncbi:MAG: threonine aldolase, partial [Chloroflexi bacterium]
SVLCGSEDFIHEARRARKIVGGGMRQAGIIAAAGIVALEEMVDRLAEDHANARRLAQGLAELPGIAIDPDTVETDIVIFELTRDDMTPAQLADGLRERGVLLSPIGGRRLRAVTHYGIEAEDIDTALMAFQETLRL